MWKKLGLGVVGFLSLGLVGLRGAADVVKAAKEAHEGLEAVMGVTLGAVAYPLGFVLMFLVIWGWLKVRSDDNISAVEAAYKTEHEALANEYASLKDTLKRLSEEYQHTADNFSAKLILLGDYTTRMNEALAKLSLEKKP